MNKKLELIIVVLIVIIGSALRLYNLGSVPPSPDWDEVALGYNAYSIMQNGRDEYGKFMPFILESFDDYKPALYMYFIIPFIYLFDLSVLAVRFPSAVFGILSIVAVYYLTKELFLVTQKKKNNRNSFYNYIPAITAFLFAISPMSIQFSRVAFETNAGAAFNIFSALFFIKGLKKPWLLSLSAAIMAFNLYLYQSEKVFTPLFALAMVIIYWKKLFIIPKKYLFAALITGLLISSPLIHYSITNDQAFARAKGVSIFSEPTEVKLIEQKKWTDDSINQNIIGKLYHNKYVVHFREVIDGYLLHYDLNWLFIRGDLARHHAPGMAILYLWELPFFLAGIYLLIFLKIPKSARIFIFTWFFLAPVPASVTNGLPHAVRTLNFLPTFQIFTALGLIGFIIWTTQIKNRLLNIKINYFIYAFCALLIIFNFLLYLNQYFVQQNYFYSSQWQYGYEEAVSEVNKIQSKYEKIIVSNEHPLDQSYMFFLFYLKYPPLVYQEEDPLRTGGFREIHHFSKYEFRPIDWKKEPDRNNRLYVGSNDDYKRGGRLIKQINFLNGDPSIIIYEE